MFNLEIFNLNLEILANGQRQKNGDYVLFASRNAIAAILEVLYGIDTEKIPYMKSREVLYLGDSLQFKVGYRKTARNSEEIIIASEGSRERLVYYEEVYKNEYEELV